ncbi:UNVERIFIED_CONTAM: Serine/threonine-protein kinase BLUS1 [Sesamum calycinum]|uniref:Serine/threonine-protein kinase BLUS1 n=1 Tax=Sesamum calycinum TaxID=2727403 RepID=A0AAW2Q4K0_9LAMI
MDQVEKKQSSSSSPDYEFPMEKSSYEMIHQIGGGLIANVFKATCKSLVVAIKIIDLEKANDEFEPLESKGITQNINHRNILIPHCSFTVDRRLWVVMPFVDKDPSTEVCLATVLREILTALLYLHGQGYVHGDIKPGNVLIGKNGRIFLADFAYSASFYERRPSSSSNIGSEYWMPPEKLKSAMSDIWSFGITALELGHGRPPLFCLPKSKSLIKKVSKRVKFCSDEKKKFKESFGLMVEMCLQKDSSKRRIAEELLKCEFLTKIRTEAPEVIANTEGLSANEEEDEDEDSELVWWETIKHWVFSPKMCVLFPFLVESEKRFAYYFSSHITVPLEALLGEGDESETIVNALVSSVEEQIERSKDQIAQLEDLIEK